MLIVLIIIFLASEIVYLIFVCGKRENQLSSNMAFVYLIM